MQKFSAVASLALITMETAMVALAQTITTAQSIRPLQKNLSRAGRMPTPQELLEMSIN